jgi:ATP-dependent RNA helicase DeaD
LEEHPTDPTVPTSQDLKPESPEPDAAQADRATLPVAGEGEHDRVVEPEDALPPATLASLLPPLREAAARAGWSELMPVQARAIPYLLAGRDLMVQSRTGSGKTGAFVLPLMRQIDFAQPGCQALVLVPTRELARQVAEEAAMLMGGDTPRTAAIYGGVAYGPQTDLLKAGVPFVVGTPGRILDHLLRGTFTLSSLRVLVFDEADRMLSMGFYPDMKRLKRYVPERRVGGWMFSATFPPYVLKLAKEFLHTPEMLSLSRDRVHVAEIQHLFYTVPGMEKDRCLVRLIETENPISALIFCNTKASVHYVASLLQRFGYDADELSSDLGQGAREKIMARLKAGNLRFLVATDVAARGIDIHELSHVFLYEPPEDPESYIHRAGRTGRAGAAGTVVSLVAGMEELALKKIAKIYGIDLQERPIPSEQDVRDVVSQRVTAMLEGRLRVMDRVQLERLGRFLPLAQSLGESEDEAYLVAMLLDDFYQPTLQTSPVPHEAKPPSHSGTQGHHGVHSHHGGPVRSGSGGKGRGRKR